MRGFYLVAIILVIGAFLEIKNPWKPEHDSTITAAAPATVPAPHQEKQEPQFTVHGPGYSHSFTRAELLRMPGARQVVVEHDPAYHEQKTSYMAVPFSQVFAGVPFDSFVSMEFKCLDGFSGVISKARALNKDPQGSVAYLAMESDDQKWPALKEGSATTPGPFYMIWENPEKSKIMIDEWPYQLAGFELKDEPLDAQFPHTVPGTDLAADSSVRQGQQLFLTNCFVCHAFNGDGKNKIGPDLNIPQSVSEYLSFKHFSMLVHNPQSLRKWEGARMPGFGAALSDDDIGKIWTYFGYMSKRKAN